MIVDEKNSSPSKKHSRYEDFVVSDDDFMVFVSDDSCEDFIVSDEDDYEEEERCRLLLPRSLINAEFFDNFLTEVEMDLLDTEAIEVNLVDDKLREFYDLHMKRWVKTSNKDYVLQKVWNKVVAENNLGPLKVSKDNKYLTMVVMEDDENQWKTDVVALVWCFQRGSKIWFAFHTQAMTEFTILGVKKDADGSQRYRIK
ncbi:hypothetical protein POM88_019487 [Heracleum sosnowskyi]|uniref:Uncharacterized protein n=1 Tax=Heracleum sosnowskyi TaxID=360622 RepID=A0AAD8MQX6_9APIA|nr:hypothetical protein POM88_019487 [Heracleum sosnowskyi]